MKMTEDEIKADLAICDVATPGPWDAPEDAQNDIVWGPDYLIGVGTMHDIADRRFVAAARTGYPKALRYLLKARQDNRDLRLIAYRRLVQVERLQQQIEALKKIAQARLENRPLDLDEIDEHTIKRLQREGMELRSLIADAVSK